MEYPHAAALHLFVDRLTQRSVLTNEEKCAILALNGQTREVSAHTDFLLYGERVDSCSLVVDGIVGRFGQNSGGDRQITYLHITGDMADLPSVVSPKSAWGLVALTATTILQVPHAELRRIAARHPASRKRSGATVWQMGRFFRNGSLMLVAEMTCRQLVGPYHRG